MSKKNKIAFEDTLERIKSIPWDKEYENLRPSKRLDLIVRSKDEPLKLKIHITGNDCVEDAQDYCSLFFDTYETDAMDGFIINSASLKNPGGGILNGSNAQEESLCRRSNLYHALSEIDKDLQFPIHGKTAGIYIPNVSFIKDVDNNMMEQTFAVNVLCLYSRPVSYYESNNIDQYDEYIKIFESMVYYANNKKANYICIPPIGCGVFGNNPSLAAKALLYIINHYDMPTVSDIYISTFGRDHKNNNYIAFHNELYDLVTNKDKDLLLIDMNEKYNMNKHEYNRKKNYKGDKDDKGKHNRRKHGTSRKDLNSNKYNI